MMKNNSTLILILMLISGKLHSNNDDFSPSDDVSLDYIHVLFNWPQMASGDIDYLLYIYDLNNDSSWVSVHDYNSFLLTGFLEWGVEYSWQVCYTSDLGSDCFQPMFFSINDLPSNYPDSIFVHQFNEDQYTPGLNFVVFYNSGDSYIVDKSGSPIAYINRTRLRETNFYASQFLSNGNIIGHSEIPLAGIGYEIDLNTNVIFRTVKNGHHHDFIKSSKGTYFGMKKEMIYIENICNDNDPLFVNWLGDVFYEYDSSGNVIWEWHTNDHLEYLEFNPDFCEGIDPNIVDWTHANSVFYDEKTHSVLISLRNISRIINIDYETGNINWQIGHEEFMDTVDYIIDFDFFGQHAAEVLDNGNILFYDNHSFEVPNISRCLEFEFDSSYTMFSQVWQFELDESLFGQFAGDCDRLDNGHTLITTGASGHIIEVDEENNIIWDISFKYNNQLMRLVRSQRIQGLYPIAFNVFLKNYQAPLISNINNTIDIILTNQSWLDNLFLIEVLQENERIYLDSLFVEHDSSLDWKINFPIVINESLTYSLKVYPENAYSKMKIFEIVFNDTLEDEYIPEDFHIYSVYPNPFNATVKIQYSIPEDGDVVLDIYNVLGEQIDKIKYENQSKGQHQTNWNSNQLASGTYFLKLSLNNRSQIHKVMLIK